MIDYSKLNPDEMTFEDAMADKAFGKLPRDYLKYITIDMPIMESFYYDMSGSEIAETMTAFAAFCVDGEMPNTEHMSTPMVKMAMRQLVRAHTERINSTYVTHYRQYVAKKKKLISDKKKARSDSDREIFELD